jgi:glycosyltransferase involved in cell wall biosynthesis
MAKVRRSDGGGFQNRNLFTTEEGVRTLQIAIVNTVYPPEPVVSAQMGRDLAIHLAQSGATVTVLCPYPSRPFGALYPNHTPRSVPQLSLEDGINVVRLPSFRAPQSRLLARMWESFSFGHHVCRYLKQHLPNLEVVYANSKPLVSQALIARYCSRWRVPLVWHIKDLYPESLLGKLPRPAYTLVAPPLISLDRWIAQQAFQTVVLSEGLRRVYMDSRSLAREKVTTIVDWVDERRFKPMPERGAACVRYGVSESKFTFLYLGNIGPVAGVELLIMAFNAAALPHAQLIIAGDGSAKAGCVQLVERLGVAGVKFISDPDAANVSLLQSLGDICLLPLRKGAGLSSIPSKVMAYLLSGKPVLATVDAESDTARCLREADCGWVGEPENVVWLTDKMKEVAAMPPSELAARGQRGLCYGERHFSKSSGVQRLADIVFAAAAYGRCPLKSGEL